MVALTQQCNLICVYLIIQFRRFLVRMCPSERSYGEALVDAKWVGHRSTMVGLRALSLTAAVIISGDGNESAERPPQRRLRFPALFNYTLSLFELAPLLCAVLSGVQKKTRPVCYHLIWLSFLSGKKAGTCVSNVFLHVSKLSSS